MYTDQLKKYGENHFKNFLGVFPLDKLPAKISYGDKFIVNTDTSNLPGEHWLAVSYRKPGIVYAFDPLGVYYPTKLINFLCHHAVCVRVNHIMYQHPLSNTCGQHCLLFLHGTI
jgi:hypothetical protein